MPWGGTRRGSSNSWLGNKPRQSGLSAPAAGSGKGRGRGSSSFFEGSSFADEIEEEEKPVLARQGTSGSSGKGRGGRGGAQFFSGSSFDDAETSPAAASASKPGGKGRGKVATNNIALEKKAPEKPKVPGLEGALAVANLEKLKDEAHAWCEQQGAAKLAEVVDFFSEFADALELKPLQRRRLWSVLAGSALAPVGVAAPSAYPVAPAAPVLAQGGGAEKLQQAKDVLAHAMWGGDAESLLRAIRQAENAGVEAAELEEARALLLDDSGPAALAELQRALKSGSGEALTEAIQHASMVGVAESELQQARAALVQQQKQDTAHKPHLAPLRSKLQAAGLAAHTDAVMEWCEENGAAHMEEVAECVDEVAEFLGLNDEERKLLESVFEEGDCLASTSGATSPPTLVPCVPETDPHDTRGAQVEQLVADKPQLAPLRLKLQVAGLSAHVNAVMQWCEDNGAAHIEEVAECVDEVAESLGLSDDERKLLESVFAEAQPSAADGAPATTPAMEEAEAGSSIQEAGGQVSPRVKGLSAAFRNAGLSMKLQVASDWCEEVGAATLEEVLENLEDLAEGIELTDPQCEALKAALTA